MIGLLIGDGNLPKVLINKLEQKKTRFIAINLSKKKYLKIFFTISIYRNFLRL